MDELSLYHSGGGGTKIEKKLGKKIAKQSKINIEEESEKSKIKKKHIEKLEKKIKQLQERLNNLKNE